MSLKPYDVIFVGLACDIVGAVILAKGFMLKEARAAFFESQTVYGANSHLLKSALLQRAEAQVGAFFLILGFGLQIWGNLHGGIAAIEPGWIDSIARTLVMLLCVAGLSFLSLQLALWRARAAFYEIFFRNYKGGKLTMPDGDPTWLDRMAQLVDLKRERNEPDVDFLARVETRRTVLGARHGGKWQALTHDE